MSLRAWLLLACLLPAEAAASTGYWLPKRANRYVPPCLGGRSRLDLAPDGVFACDALPARVTFPMGFEVRALEDKHSATLITVYPGGALAFHYTVTTWRPSDANIVAEIDTAQEELLRLLTVVDGVKVLGHAPAKLEGAPVGRTVTFTDRQGKVRGEMRTFIATGWGLSLIAFGTEGHLLEPSAAIARAFLASLHVVEPAAPPPLEISATTRLRLPAGAYEVPAPGGPRFYLVPGALAHIGVFDAGINAACKSALSQARSPSVMQGLIQGSGVRATVDAVSAVGDANNRWRGSIRSASGPGSLSMAGLLHCAGDNRMVMVQINGETPQGTLDGLLDVVAVSLGAGR